MSWANIVEKSKKIEKKDNEKNKEKDNEKEKEKEKQDNIDKKNDVVELNIFKYYDDEFYDIYQHSIINIKEELEKNISYNAYPFLDNLQLFSQYSLINLIITFSINYEQIVRNVDNYNNSLDIHNKITNHNDFDLFDEY